MDIQQLVEKAIDRGILVTEELLEDPAKLAARLAHEPYTVEVVQNYTKEAKPRTVEDFVRHFNMRYRVLKNILMQRKEMESVVSIARLKGKRERETVTFIGMVVEKKQTKNNHIVLQLEDPTGQIEVWVHADNKALQTIAQEIVHDEVLGCVGQTANGRVFANTLVFPDVPSSHVLKKGHRDAHVVFVGDVEVGSKLFMKNEFQQMILWLRGELGNDEQKEIAKTIGYVVFIGDLVHGVGIYPGQQEDSNIHDIKQQYDQFTSYIKQIPSHIQVILITGNHDAGRLQEPQLPVYKDFGEELYEMPNVHVLSNPSYVKIDKTDDHPGFDLLLYHGYSLIYYAKELQTIKDAGGLHATQEIMKLYLKKRHLSPTHGCNTYIPDPEGDPMVIGKIPDFLVTGHVHNIGYGTYHGVQLINPGCWNDVSDEQIKRGLEPEPARLPVVNLRNRDLRIVNFYPEKK